MTEGQLAYIRRVLGGRTAPVLESMAADGSARQETAAVALESLQTGGMPAPGQLAVLEAIVRKEGRPVWKVKNDSFTNPGPSWPQVETARPHIENAIRAIGRIDLKGHPSMPYGGTGFVVGPGLLMTNRHVAELFATGAGFNAEFRAGLSSSVDFKQETDSDDSVRLNVLAVLMIHPYWDCALLRVQGLDAARPQLSLCGTVPANLSNRDVVVIGYPAFNPDPTQNPALQIQTFEGVFQKKRLQPGTLMGHPFPVESYGKVVDSVAHDCSTLGGNSGSAVIDLETGCVLALHFSGAYLFANYAVPGWQLALDHRLADEGVRFKDRPATFDAPGWLDSWSTHETAPPAEATAETSNGWLGGDWYERLTDAEIARAYAVSPADTKAALEQTLGSAPPRSAFAATSSADPELPEIVLLPGHLGTHLDGDERVWLSSLHGDFARRLRSVDLQPTQHLRLLYQPAIRMWKTRGFSVHVFAYDWRQRLADSARRFHHYIECLRTGRTAVRFALVAHGLGGLVACKWALDEPRWSDVATRAVLAGVPLHGWQWPVDAITGDLPLFRNLAVVDPSNDLDGLRAMAATFAGWTAMLPDPSTFNDAEGYYTRSYWPDGIAPPQRDLDESRNAKADLPQSPLLRRSAIIDTSAEIDVFSNPDLAQQVADVLCGAAPAIAAPAALAPAQASPAVSEPVVPAGLRDGRLSLSSLRWLIGYTSRIM